MATQPPPGPIQEVTSGPFSSFLQPQPVQDLGKFAPPPNGMATKSTRIGDVLTSFMQGAMQGRANADAKSAQQQALQQYQDAQHLSQYQTLVQNSDIDPDVKQQLIAKAVQAQGGMVSQVMEQSNNPIMKALHPVLQTLMGGPHADESTQKDSSGKKKKVKTDYQGMDPDAYKGLMSDYFNASQNQTIEKTYPVKSAALIDQAKAATAGLAQINGQEPTREQVQRAVAPLLSQGDALAQKYGMKTNPVGDWLETYQPKLQGTQRLQEAQAKELEDYDTQAKQITGGQATQTQPPPSRDQFSLPTGGPASRETPAQRDVSTPPSAQAKTGNVDPSFLDRAVSVGRATREESVIDGDKQIPTVRWNGKTYDGDGNVIPASKIGKIITGPRGTPIRIEQTDKDGGKYAVYAFNDGSGKLSIPKDPDTNEPYRVPKTEAGLRGQITEVFQSVQQLQRQIFAEQNKLQTIEKDVSNDFTIPPSKKAAEVARRRAEIQPRIDQMNKNLEANQKILMQYGGPGALYDTGMGSSPPPNEYVNQLDQLPQ